MELDLLTYLSPVEESTVTRDEFCLLFAQHNCMGWWREEYATMFLGTVIDDLVSRGRPSLDKLIAALRREIEKQR